MTVQTKKIVLFVVALLAIGVAIYWLLTGSGIRYTSERTALQTAITKDPAVGQAEQALSSGHYDSAIAAYETALSSASDDFQKGSIELRIAESKQLSGDYVGAIDAYKAIAANTSYGITAKAYAVQSLASLLVRPLDPKTKANIKSAVFKDTPYSGMVVKGDTALTNRHLSEYATSFFPLALSEVRVGEWYAVQIAKNPSAPEATSYLDVVKQKLDAAEVDIKRTESYENAKLLIPEARLREAFIKENLAIAGAGSAADAEAAYQTALSSYSAYQMPAGSDGIARYRFAQFLARTYGKSHASPIKSLLDSLSGATYKQSAVMTYLKNARTSTTLKKGVQATAALDPAFKTLLVSLGWTASDF